ncbi:MAG TPA: crosslink repair DNA glycosylase YcaQ family protein [Methylomirabilota bacterium]|nr:crosslink repair DNA glycosylase YcaQ family protein [Methylomirabilota bacterium]
MGSRSQLSLPGGSLDGLLPNLTRERLERYRDEAFRRLPGRRVRSAREALAFVEAVGICSTFYRFPEGLGCLWEAVAGRRDPRWPRRSHHDAGIGLTWELKDTLPARRAVYYGKLLKGRPVLVALDLFPAFYALVRGRQRARDYRLEYEAGRLSLAAKRLMDVLIRRHPLYTREWRAECFMLDPGRTREFERAVAELQQGLFVAKVEERYDPTFSYRWDLLEAWLPEKVRAGRRLSRRAAVHHLVARYLGAVGWTTVRQLARLFGLGRSEVADALGALVRAGAARTDVAVPGLPVDLVVHRALLERLGAGS